MDLGQLAEIISSQGDIIAIYSEEGKLLQFLADGSKILYGCLASRMRSSSLDAVLGEQVPMRIRLACRTKELATCQYHDEASDQWFWVRISPLPFPIDGMEAVLLAVINNTSMQKQNKRLSRLCLIDSLTSVYNRRMMESVLVPLVIRALSNDSLVCAVIIDIDHFKSINDLYGHCVGDQMLRHTAEWGRIAFPELDIVRYGGDEFVLFSIDRPAKEIEDVSKKLCKDISKTAYKEERYALTLTVSIGIGVSGKRTSYYELFHLADTALYQAKALGRNQVVVHRFP
ncbi:MAG: GGDEF domain-containing protein [Sphaerochaetaceae bacterium]